MQKAKFMGLKGNIHKLHILNRIPRLMVVCYFILSFANTNCSAEGIDWEAATVRRDKFLAEAAVQEDLGFQRQLIKEKQLRQIETDAIKVREAYRVQIETDAIKVRETYKVQIETDAIKERETYRIQMEAQKRLECELRLREEELSRQSKSTIYIVLSICFAGICTGTGIYFSKRR